MLYSFMYLWFAISYPAIFNLPSSLITILAWPPCHLLPYDSLLKRVVHLIIASGSEPTQFPYTQSALCEKLRQYLRVLPSKDSRCRLATAFHAGVLSWDNAHYSFGHMYRVWCGTTHVRRARVHPQRCTFA
jgi:hypothetical protein